MASLSTLDWTKLVMLVPGLALSYLLVLFVTHYRSAWLKTLMVACYLVAVVATMGEIVFVAYFPQFSTQVTIFYNLFGQLIASLGIVESAQCLYSNARLVYITHTNWTFLKVWIGSCGVLLIPYAAAASHLLRLKYYRFLSITLIIAESVCYGWLMRTMTNMRGGRATMLYYIITILCRLGIVSGIVLRIINGNRDLIGIIHYTAVILTSFSLIILTKFFRLAITRGRPNLRSSCVVRRGSRKRSRSGSLTVSDRRNSPLPVAAHRRSLSSLHRGSLLRHKQYLRRQHAETESENQPMGRMSTMVSPINHSASKTRLMSSMLASPQSVSVTFTPHLNSLHESQPGRVEVDTKGGIAKAELEKSPTQRKRSFYRDVFVPPQMREITPRRRSTFTGESKKTYDPKGRSISSLLTRQGRSISADRVTRGSFVRKSISLNQSTSRMRMALHSALSKAPSSEGSQSFIPNADATVTSSSPTQTAPRTLLSKRRSLDKSTEHTKG